MVRRARPQDYGEWQWGASPTAPFASSARDGGSTGQVIVHADTAAVACRKPRRPTGGTGSGGLVVRDTGWAGLLDRPPTDQTGPPAVISRALSVVPVGRSTTTPAVPLGVRFVRRLGFVRGRCP